MTYRIKLVHIGKKDEMNTKLIQLMSSTSSSSSSVRNVPEEISLHTNGINLLVNITDETEQVKNGRQWIFAKPVYAFGAGAILIYDATRRESLQDSFDWISAFKQHAPQSAVVLLIANTSRVNTGSRAISAEEGGGFAKSAGVLYCEASIFDPTSAKQALNFIVENISQKIANGTIQPRLEEGVESVLRSPVARSCASPLSPREPLVYPIPNTQQKSWGSETVPKEVELESKLCFAEQETERMKKSCETEKNKWIMQEQKLIQANTELKSKMEMMKSEKVAIQMSLDELSLKKQFSERNSEIKVLMNENATLKQRLKQSTSHFKQESFHLSNAMKSSAQESAFRQNQFEHELSLKEMALQNEAQRRAEAEATLHQTQIALNQAMAEDHSFHHLQTTPVIGDNWKVARHEITFNGAPLGRGAWGYVAEGTFRGKTVAVKCLHEAIMNHQTTERVRREINTMASIRHPNIVLFIAAVLDEGPPVIISELLGTNLRTAYEQRLVNGINAKLNILHGVACALNYFHQQHDPIIHRDISAPNVLLKAAGDDKWTPKVSDFGSANLAQYSQTLGEGAIIYAAPETYPSNSSLQSVTHTTKIDVYSYGVLVGELLTEELPNPSSIHLTLQRIKAEWPHIHRMMELCIKRNPRERPTMNTVIVDHLDPLLAR